MGHLTSAMFEEILSQASVRPRVYIETGCNVGDQLCVARKHFDKCYGIELHTPFYHTCRARFEEDVVVVLNSDTRVMLPRLLNHSMFQQPVFFLLDAHYTRFDPPIPKGEFPLWDELCMLRPRKWADIIVVDDVHTFGKKRDDLRFGDAPEWEGITCDVLASFFGQRGKVVGDGYVIHRKART
jgi:hypothetical protein